ncbi:hypothetical protein QF028_002599 [Neobacillus sp. B4I6]|uniref:hypothetical protein n=1 Tax=Neobacillus sp. B4I6 TaxID=3373925 RepID=UPI003D19BABD
MYKLQFCNAFTQELLREATYGKVDVIQSLIESAQKNVGSGLDSFIIDNELRTLRAEYVTHSMIHQGNETVYKLFFKVKLSEVQARITK